MVPTLPLRRSSRSAFLRALALAAVLTAALLALMNSGLHPQPGPMERSSFRGGAGYWLLGKDGGVFAFGDAKYYGANRNQGKDIAGMAATASGNGYWTVDDDGDVFAYGDAIDYGSRPGPEIDDITGFAVRSQGDGYWMVAKDGSVSHFGAAGYFGGANTLKLTKPIVGMAATPSGKGYWLIAGDGGVFAYGDAGFFGSTGNIKLNKPIVDFGPSASGDGYRFIGNDGGVFAYGDGKFYGSTGAMTLNKSIVGFAATASGKGYWLVGEDGGVFAFGDAEFFGSTGRLTLNAPIVAIVATPRVKVAPVANDDAKSVAEDTPVTIDVEANDTHALPASVSIETKPQHGTATVVNGKVVYTPAINYHGPDSFKYTLTDTVGHSATATVSLTVTPVNDAPVAAPGSRSATEDTLLSSSVSATDVENDPLIFSMVADPSHGALTMNAEGTFTYMPTADYAGSDSFTFKASDGKANSNTATVNITVAGTQDVPTIADVIDRSTAEDTAIGAINVTVGDVDGDTLTLSGSSSNDTLVPDANVVVGGSAANPTVTVTPAANLSGTSTITLTVSDGNGGTASDTFVLTVTPVNDAPTITDIADLSTERNTPTADLNFTIGDTDEAAAGLTLSGSSSNTTLVPNGNIAFGGSGANRTVTVTPASGQSGTATITVTVTDANSSTASESFVLTVNDNPTISAMPDVKVSEDTATGALAFTVGDSETLAGDLTVTASSSDQDVVADGDIDLGGSGASRTVTITPVTDASGPTTITITVEDGDGGSASESFTLTVAVNDQPDPQDDSVSLAVALFGIDVLANDLGVSDGPLTVEIVAGGEGTGIVIANQIQLQTYLDSNDDDLISFQYKATDADGDFAFGTVTVSLI